MCSSDLGSRNGRKPLPLNHSTTAAGPPASARSVATSLQTAELLPAAPKVGSARYEADRQVFLATRKLQDSPRWTLAQQDVDYATPKLMADFSCAVGAPLDASKLPKLAALVDATSNAADASTGPAKKANKRQRPFLIDQGATCQRAMGSAWVSSRKRRCSGVSRKETSSRTLRGTWPPPWRVAGIKCKWRAT